ncbi:MAG: Ig-like domain-containing protein [Actinomycetota bacterium]|nr:Ig-like domain-containing protein [Actinomycetota bacterium]
MSHLAPRNLVWSAVLVTVLVLTVAVPRADAAEPGVVADVTWGISRAEVDREVSLLKENGARWVRTNVPWNAIEYDGKGTYNASYLSNVDYAIQQLRAAGIGVVMPVSDGVPYWASADPNKYKDSGGYHYNERYRPTSFQDYADFFSFVVNRYKGSGVHVFEVWNEPNLSEFWPSGVNASEYTQMLKAAYPAIKAADPSSTVLLGGLSGSDWSFLQGVYAAGGGSYFDAAANHIYANGSPDNCWQDSTGHNAKDSFCGVDEVREVMVANGDAAKAMWITEFGWSTCSNSYSGCYNVGVTEEKQAEYLTRAFQKFDSPAYSYVKAALVYSARNTYWKKDDPASWEGNLGMVKTDWTVKPALAAFKAYATATTEPTPDPAPDPAPLPDPAPANAPPTVTLTSPTDGSTFTSTVSMAAGANDDHGVTKVEFYFDGRLKATDSTAPYSYSFKVPRKTAYGTHTVDAKAYDAAGLTARSSAAVTRVNSTTSTSLNVSSGTSVASSGRGRLLSSTGKVLGRVRGASQGHVEVRVQQRDARTRRWVGRSTRRLRLDSGGRFAGRALKSPGSGIWRAQAIYRGGDSTRPSRSAWQVFRVR